MKPLTESVATFRSELDPCLQEIFDTVRSTVRETGPNLIESIKWHVPAYSLDRPLMVIQASRGYLRLEFFDGNLLDDPSSLLEGHGIRVRHVKLYSPADGATKALVELIAMAVTVGGARS